MLDTRSQRDDISDTDDASKSMLDGDNLPTNDQKTWLLDGLKNSTAKWKLVVSSVTANTSARPASNDHWMGGFSNEVAELNSVTRLGLRVGYPLPLALSIDHQLETRLPGAQSEHVIAERPAGLLAWT